MPAIVQPDTRYPGEGGQAVELVGEPLRVDRCAQLVYHDVPASAFGGGDVGTGNARGGGIYDEAGTTVTLQQESPVTGNTAHSSGGGGSTAQGGGIYSHGTLTLTDSSVTGNEASALFGFVEGGGIYNTGSVTLVGSTVVADNQPDNCAGTTVPGRSG